MPHPGVAGQASCGGRLWAVNEIDVGNGWLALNRYRFAQLICRVSSTEQLKHSTGLTWERPFPEEETEWLIELVEGDPPVDCRLTMTATGVSRGQVTVTLSRAAGGMVAKWTNLALWQPNQPVCFRLVDRDLSATKPRWYQYPILSPDFYAPCPNGPVIPYVLWHMPEWTSFPAQDVALLPFGGYDTYAELESAYASMGAPIGPYYGETPCAYYAIVTLSETVTLFANLSDAGFHVAGGTMYVYGSSVSGPIFEGENHSPIPLDGSTATFTGGTVDLLLTPAINGVIAPEIPCNPLPTTCIGSSEWYLRRKCYDGVSAWLYYFEPVSNTCRGRCESNACRPTPPIAIIDDELYTDEEAEALGWLDLLDTIVSGDCECRAAYVEPECPPCTCDDAPEIQQIVIEVIPEGECDTYGGTFNLFKGGTEGDECEGCCWGGGAAYLLKWSDVTNKWTFTDGNSGSVYESGAGTPSSLCAQSTTLNKISGPICMPSIINVTGDPA